MSPRAIRVGLLASLALNLFLAGVLAVAVLRPKAEPERNPPRGPRGYWAAAETFDPVDREAMHQILRGRAEEARPRVLALRAARRDAAEAMARPEYDPDAVRAAKARAHQEELALRREMDEAVIVFAQRLDPQERARLADAMRRRGKRGDRDGRDRGDRGNREQQPKAEDQAAR